MTPWETIAEGVVATAAAGGTVSILAALFRGKMRRREPITIVALRSMETPASHWEEAVYYDVWGSPFVKSYGDGPGPHDYGTMALLAGGETSETALYGTEWRHKSGPQIIFPNKPERPFP